MLGFIDGSTGNKNSQPKLLTYPKSQEDISLWPNATLEIAQRVNSPFFAHICGK